MNLQEFRAWFEGFTEGMDGVPTKKQWARIQERVGQIKDAPPVTQKVFMERYWPTPYYPPYVYGSPPLDQYTVTCSSAVADKCIPGQNFVSANAFRSLGTADAQLIG